MIPVEGMRPGMCVCVCDHSHCKLEGNETWTPTATGQEIAGAQDVWNVWDLVVSLELSRRNL